MIMILKVMMMVAMVVMMTTTTLKMILIMMTTTMMTGTTIMRTTIMMRRSTTIHYDDSDGVCGVVCFTVVALVVRFVGFGEAAPLSPRLHVSLAQGIFPWRRQSPHPLWYTKPAT